MQGKYDCYFQGRKADIQRLICKLSRKNDPDHHQTGIYNQLKLPEQWNSLVDDDWVIATSRSLSDSNINYFINDGSYRLYDCLFTDLGSVNKMIEGFVKINTIDGFDCYLYSGYASDDVRFSYFKSDISDIVSRSEKVMGCISVTRPKRVDEFRYVSLQKIVANENQQGEIYEKAYAFAWDITLESVTIPSSVRFISKGCFCDCTGLTGITIPDSVQSIGANAFSGCTELTDIMIPDSVQSIGVSAFSGCTGLTSIMIPEGVTSIGANAFSGCTGLTSITIPESMTEIRAELFDITDGLHLVAPHIDPSECSAKLRLSLARGYAVAASKGLVSEKAKHKENLKFIKAQRKKLYPYATVEPELMQLMLGEKMIGAGEYQFVFDMAQKENRIEIIAMLIDYKQNSLKEADVKKAEIQKNAEEESGILSPASARLSWKYKKKEDETLQISEYIGSETDVFVPRGIGKALVTEIGDDAFSAYKIKLDEYHTNARKAIKSVTVPKGVTSIGWSAFKGCSSLTSITIPESVTSIGGSAFYGCSSLTSITIPDSVTSIKEGVFYGCSSLTSIAIPDSVTSIGFKALYGCSSLTSITIPESVTKIGNEAFSGCKNLTIHAPAGSTAEAFAKKKKIPFESI